jgi:fumarate reductase subunit D
VTAGVRRRYGARGLHLVGHITAFAVSAYALAQIIHGGRVVNFAAWFVGAAVLHDIVFLPLYSLLDRVGHRVHRARPRAAVPVINHLRAPALISGLLFLVYFPLILGTGQRSYFAASGHHPHGYARNWALITAALFTASAILYAVRILWRTRR